MNLLLFIANLFVASIFALLFLGAILMWMFGIGYFAATNNFLIAGVITVLGLGLLVMICDKAVKEMLKNE